MAKRIWVKRGFTRIPAIRLAAQEDVQAAQEMGYPSVQKGSVIEFPGEPEKRKAIWAKINKRAEEIRQIKKVANQV